MHTISSSDHFNNVSLVVMICKFTMKYVVVNLSLPLLFLRLFHVWIAAFLKFSIYSFYTNIAPFYLLYKLYFLYKYCLWFFFNCNWNIKVYYSLFKNIFITLDFFGGQRVYQVPSWNSPLLPPVFKLEFIPPAMSLCIMNLLQWFYF